MKYYVQRLSELNEGTEDLAVALEDADKLSKADPKAKIVLLQEVNHAEMKLVWDTPLPEPGPKKGSGRKKVTAEGLKDTLHEWGLL